MNEKLYELESKLLQKEIRHSTGTLEELLADDFVEYGRSGRVYDKKQMVKWLPKSRHFQVDIENFEVINLAVDVALVTYRSVRQADEPVHSLRSSIWKQIEGRWQMVFHQGTPSDAKGEF